MRKAYTVTVAAISFSVLSVSGSIQFETLSYCVLGLYVIIEGEVELSLGDRQIIGHLAQGEIFGEKASLLSGQLADVSVKAIQDVELLRIDVKTLQHLLSDNPILASTLGEMMELRRKSLKTHLEKV